MKPIFFLSGLPRCGSTVLGSILAQSKAVSVTLTSPLLDLLAHFTNVFQKVGTEYTFDADGLSKDVFASLIASYYNQFETSIIIDKHRGWPRNIIPASFHLNANPKVICTIRPMSEIITSYLKIMAI